MSQRCCNKQCFFQNIAYSMVFNNFLNGLRGLWEASFETVILGLFFIGFGVVLLLGLRKNSPRLIVVFLFGTPTLLALDLIKNFMDLGNLNKFGDDYEKKRIFLILNVVGDFINCVMLGVVFFYYRDIIMKAKKMHSKDVVCRSNETVNTDAQEYEKKNDCDEL